MISFGGCHCRGIDSSTGIIHRTRIALSHAGLFYTQFARFISIFGSLEAIEDKLVWLPTWHQARLLAMRLGVSHEKMSGFWGPDSVPSPGDALLGMYRLIIAAL